MKLSETKPEALEMLSEEQMAHILFDGVADDGKRADVALLLGSRPVWCHPRALAAAELYHAGRVSYIMPTGGVEWEHEGERISEAHYMRRVLLAQGVPDEAILLENEATTTKENMLYGVIQINRHLKLQNARRICIVTSANHMRRSMGLARWLMPRTAELSCYPSELPADPVAAIRELGKERNLRAIKLLQGLIQNGFIEEIEY